jgi:hypothetical protein
MSDLSNADIVSYLTLHFDAEENNLPQTAQHAFTHPDKYSKVLSGVLRDLLQALDSGFALDSSEVARVLEPAAKIITIDLSSDGQVYRLARLTHELHRTFHTALDTGVPVQSWEDTDETSQKALLNFVHKQLARSDFNAVALALMWRHETVREVYGEPSTVFPAMLHVARAQIERWVSLTGPS